MFVPFNYADVQFTTVPADVQVQVLAQPPVEGAPSACTDCGAKQQQPGFLGMPGVDFFSFSTWPYSFKVGAGVLGAYAIYKVAMR